MIYDGTTEFFSDRPVSYTAKGVVKETNAFTLCEPGMDHYKYYTRIKQMFMRVFKEMHEKRTGGEIFGEDISGEELKGLDENHEQNSAEEAAALEMLLLVSEKVDVAEFIDAFRAMACMNSRKAIVRLDGEQAMTDAIWSNMHPDDGYKMAVRWAAFFAMPSADGQKTMSNKPSASSGQPKAV